MPQSEELSVRFVGEDGSLTKSLGSLQDQLKRFEKGLKDADNATSFNRIQRAISETKTRIDVMQKAGGQLGQSLGTGLKRGSDQATQSLINLSRVAQDAPYGFLGIANNLNPLLESFQRLKAETGSTKTALSALGSSLIGPGGIGLALGVVSSLLVVFGDKLFGSTKATEANKNEVAAAATAYEKFREELSKIVDTIGKEAAKIALLQSSLSDSNNSLNDRKNIISELNEIYPSYLNKLGEEKTKYDALKSSIEGSIKALAQAAEIKAIFPSVEKMFSEAISSQVELNRLRRLQTPGGFFALEDADFKAEEKVLTDSINRNLNEIQHAKDALAKLAGGEKNLFEIIFGKIDDKAGAEDKAAHKRRMAELKKQFEEERELWEKRQLEIRQFLAQGAEGGGVDPIRNFIKEQVEEAHKFDDLFVLRPKKLTVDFSQTTMEVRFANKLKEINEVATNALQAIGTQMGVGIGNAFANAITGQSIGDALKGMFSGIGSIIQQLGAQVIALSPIIKALKLSLKSFSPAGILVAGVGLVALGGIIKNLTAPTGLAEGGIIPPGFSNDTFPARLSSNEAVIPLDKIHKYIGTNNGDGDVLITRFRGNDMELMLARNGKRNGRVR